MPWPDGYFDAPRECNIRKSFGRYLEAPQHKIGRRQPLLVSFLKPFADEVELDGIPMKCKRVHIMVLNDVVDLIRWPEGQSVLCTKLQKQDRPVLFEEKQQKEKQRRELGDSNVLSVI